jgi:hypothetical protein
MKSMISCIGVPGRKMPLTPISFNLGMSTSGMMPPMTTRTSSSPFSDDVSVLLERGRDDLLRRLPQPRVDDFHAGVTQRAGDDLGAAVVPVETGFGDDDPEFAHQMIGTSSYSPHTSRSASHISPIVA